MGNALSEKQDAHRLELQFLLCKAGHEVSHKILAQLLKEIDSHCPWYPEAGSLSVKDWEQIGQKLHEEPHAPIAVLHAWCLCRDAISHFGVPTIPLPEYQPPLSVAPIVSHDPSPKLMEMPPRMSPMIGCMQEALNQGDLSPLAVCPILHGPGQKSISEHLPYTVLKELKRSINDNGLSNSLTTGILDGVAGGYEMTPWDWKQLIQMAVTPLQYMVWQQYSDLAAIATMNNPTAGINVDHNMLMGVGPLANLQQELARPQVAIQQAAEIAVKGWRRMPDGRSATLSFSGVR